MTEIRDWKHARAKWVGVLEKRTGVSLAAWNARVKKEAPSTRSGVTAWLSEQGVEGYGRTILLMERFGYPEWLTAGADELVDAQYEGKPNLRKVYDRVIKAVSRFKGVAVQTRKTYISLVTPRRTFARVQAGKDHVKIALRLEGRRPGGRLQRSRVHDEMPVEIAIENVKQIDAEAIALLREAYEESL